MLISILGSQTFSPGNWQHQFKVGLGLDLSSGTEVTLKAPKVPYRETIRGRAEAQGRHKKQTGGHGQFGDCKLRMEI